MINNAVGNNSHASATHPAFPEFRATNAWYLANTCWCRCHFQMNIWHSVNAKHFPMVADKLAYIKEDEYLPNFDICSLPLKLAKDLYLWLNVFGNWRIVCQTV